MKEDILNVTHAQLAYPLHADEWGHLSFVMYTLREGKPPFYYPFNGDPIFNPEAGFHLLLAGFFWITRLDPVMTFQYLPGIFAAWNALMIVFLIGTATRRWWAGILSAFLFTLLPSNVNLLGSWFAVPSTLSVGCIAGTLALYHRWHRERDDAPPRRLLEFIAALIVSGLLYPLAPALIAIGILATTPFDAPLRRRIGSVFSRWPVAAWTASAMAVATFTAILAIPPARETLMPFLLVARGWTDYEMTFSLPYLFGITICALALIGIAVWALKRHQRVLPGIAGFLVANMLLDMITDVSLIVPYQRTVFYLMAFASLFAGFGLYHAARWAGRRTVVAMERWKGAKGLIPATGGAAVAAIIVIGCMGLVLNEQSGSDSHGIIPYLTMTDEMADAFRWIGDTQGPDHFVLANARASLGIYPLSGNYPIAIPNASLRTYTDVSYERFLKVPCWSKTNLAIAYNIEYVVTPNPLFCDSFEAVHAVGENTIYRTAVDRQTDFEGAFDWEVRHFPTDERIEWWIPSVTTDAAEGTFSTTVAIYGDGVLAKSGYSLSDDATIAFWYKDPGSAFPVSLILRNREEWWGKDRDVLYVWLLAPTDQYSQMTIRPSADPPSFIWYVGSEELPRRAPLAKRPFSDVDIEIGIIDWTAPGTDPSLRPALYVDGFEVTDG
ncbi:hypothetical protein JXB02_06730 [Candidatus Woesearchaeota archaeon]|nr:hypothetical protein [Candidatus Woesearchaeota archaeon]